VSQSHFDGDDYAAMDGEVIAGFFWPEELKAPTPFTGNTDWNGAGSSFFRIFCMKVPTFCARISESVWLFLSV